MPTLQINFFVIYIFSEFIYKYYWIVLKEACGIPQKCGATKVWNSTHLMGRRAVKSQEHGVQSERRPLAKVPYSINYALPSTILYFVIFV